MASHFKLFSGVTAPYSAITIAAYDASLRVFLSAAVPTYFRPLAFIFASKLPVAGCAVEVGPPGFTLVVGGLAVVVAAPGIHCE